MATGTLTGQTIANTYKALLKITGTTAGGETLHATTQKVIEDGDGNPFPYSAAQDALLMVSTNRLEFGDTGTYIFQSADGVLDLVSDTEIEINATTIDINGAVDISGDTTTAGDIKIGADDKALVLGAGQDASIFADDAGVIKFVRGIDVTPVSGDSEGWIAMSIGDNAETVFEIRGGEGDKAKLNMYADGGDDNDDYYRIVSDISGNFVIESYSTGSWVPQLKLDGSTTDVTVSTGNLVIATADKGISFTGGTDPDTAGSATANILDDYEEGTWTPAWSFDGGGSVGHSGQTGHYTRVGRLVTCTFDIIVNSTSGSPVGSATLTGFPFTNDNVSSRGMVGVSYSTGFGTIPVTGYINQNAANAAILVSHGDSYLTHTAFGGNERMMGSFLYYVA